MATNWNNIETKNHTDNSRDIIEGAKSLTKEAASKTAEVVKDITSGGNPEGVGARESGEGTVTKRIESVSSKIPSATFLGLALGVIGVSASLRVMGFKKDAVFVGQWVSPILILGLYNKLVKLDGSE